MAKLLVLAEQLLDRLLVEFDVMREEGFGLDAELEQCTVIRPSIELIPRNTEAAPLTVAFAGSPALHVRFGRWYTRAFPQDLNAEDATFEEERERFVWRVQQLTEGRYREAITPGPPGMVVLQHAFWSPDGTRAGGESKIEVIEEAASIEAALEWQPWQRRNASRAR